MEKYSKFVFKLLLFLIFAGISLSIYTLVSLFLSHTYLTGARGTDTLAFISRLKFLADYFPSYPVWTPREGAGFSAIYSYPILVHTLIIIIEKISVFNLAETVKLVGFMSVPFFGLSLFTYVWFRFGKPVVAFLSGLIYVISPIAWIFLYEWGFYAESVAAILFPLAILFYELYIERIVDGINDLKSRVIFIVTSILLFLSILSHPTIFTAEVSFFAFYPIISAVFASKSQKIKVFWRVAVKSLLIIITSVGLASFWFFPFNHYLGLANANSPGAGVINPKNIRDGLHEVEIKFKEVLTFDVVTDKTNRRYNFRSLSFPVGVSILYIVGLVLPFILREKRQMVSFINSFIVSFIAVTTPIIIMMAMMPVPFMSQMASWRSLIYSARMFVPIISAFCLYSLFSLLSIFIKPKHWLLKFSKEFAISILVLISFISIVYYFHDKPAILNKDVVYGQGVSETDYWSSKKDNICGLEDTKDENRCKSQLFKQKISVMDFRNQCDSLNNLTAGQEIPQLCSNVIPNNSDIYSFLNECENGLNKNWNDTICTARYEPFVKQITNWSEWKRAYGLFWESDENNFVGMFRNVFNEIPEDDFTRYDVSPNAVTYSIIGPIATHTPMLSTYFSPSSLINRYWGYQLSNFYASDPVYSDSFGLKDITKWFGIKYVISGQPDPVNKFIDAGYSLKSTSYPIYEFSEDQKTVEIFTKPKILVIGDSGKRVYDIILKYAPFGMISYDKYTLIHGSSFVDDYSLDELKKYDLIILYGQKYKSQYNSRKLITQYVDDGGSIFIETGWQYNSPEWNIGNTPDFIPLENLTWTNFGKSSNYSLDSNLFDNSNIDIKQFAPLIWNDLPWGVSSSDYLKPWAKKILEVEGHPLIAGGILGKGKIVWSGMNIFGHLKGYSSENNEIKLVANIISWLADTSGVKNYVYNEDFSAKRLNPDLVEFDIKNDISTPASLYFKEAYYPLWSANVVKNDSSKIKLTIQKAWPMLMYVDLPNLNSGDKVIFQIIKPAKHVVAQYLSVFTIIVLALYIFIPRIFVINIKLKPKNISTNSNEDTDY